MVADIHTELDRDSEGRKYSLDGPVKENLVLVLELKEQLGQLVHAHLCEGDVGYLRSVSAQLPSSLTLE